MEGGPDMSRRKFLGGALAAGTVLASSEVFAQSHSLESKLKEIDARAQDLARLKVGDIVAKSDPKRVLAAEEFAKRWLNERSGSTGVTITKEVSLDVAKESIRRNAEVIKILETNQQQLLSEFSTVLGTYVQTMKSFDGKRPTAEEQERLEDFYAERVRPFLNKLDKNEEGFLRTPTIEPEIQDIVARRRGILENIRKITDDLDPYKIFKR